MTHPKESVEAVARALFSQANGNDGQGLWHWHNEHGFRTRFAAEATAILDRIAPILIAQAVEAERAACNEELRLAVAAEREACAKVAEVLHETAWPDTIAAAIRAREATP